MKVNVTKKDKADINKEKFFKDLLAKLEKGEEDIKNGRVYSARTVFNELRSKYNY